MYTIDPVEETAKKIVSNDDISWSVQYELRDRNDRKIGFGVISLQCKENHEHLEEKKVYATLVRIGAMKIKDDIEDERELKDQKYDIKVENCLHAA